MLDFFTWLVVMMCFLWLITLVGLFNDVGFLCRLVDYLCCVWVWWLSISCLGFYWWLFPFDFDCLVWLITLWWVGFVFDIVVVAYVFCVFCGCSFVITLPLDAFVLGLYGFDFWWLWSVLRVLGLICNAMGFALVDFLTNAFGVVWLDDVG